MPIISLLSITPAILSRLIWTAQPILSTFPVSPYNSPISTFFLLLTHLPSLPANYPSSPLSFGITNDDSRTNKIPTAHFSLFTFLPYPSHYKPRVFWHTKPCVFSKPINNITCNISKKQIPTFLHQLLHLHFYYLLPHTTNPVIYHTLYSTVMVGRYLFFSILFPFPLPPLLTDSKFALGYQPPPHQTPSKKPPPLSC